MFAHLLLLAGEVEAAAGGGSLPQLDLSTWPAQIFWLAVLFSFMFAMMNWQFLPKLGGIIEERKNRIADFYDKAAEFKRQAETAEKEYQQALADAKARAASINAETRDAMDKEINDIQAENDAKLANSIEAAETRISEMRAEARSKVGEAAIETTKSLVSSLTGQEPSTAVVKDAVEKAA